jgi:hypothetical protein
VPTNVIDRTLSIIQGIATSGKVQTYGGSDDKHGVRDFNRALPKWHKK